MIHPMQYELERAYPTRYEHNGARMRQCAEAAALRKAKRLHIAWTSLFVIVLLVILLAASLGFNAGVIAALTYPLQEDSQSQSQSQYSSVERVCGPIEAGVDAQCFDSP